MTTYLFFIVPKGFIPDVDNDQLSATMEAAQGTSFYQMVAYSQKVTDILRQDPDIDTIIPSVGWAVPIRPRYSIQLKPRRDRRFTVNQIAERLRPKVSRIPGVRVFLTIPQAIRIGGRQSKSSYDFTVQGPDTAELYLQAQKLEREIAQLPILQDVTTDLQIKTPRVNVEIRP